MSSLPCRREANAWCDVYLYMQPSTSRVWGFFCSNALTRYLLVGGLGDMCLSRSLFLSLLLEATRHLRLALEFWLRCTHAPTWSSTFDNDTTAGIDSRVAMSHVSGGFRCRNRVADELACPTDCRKFEMLSYRSKIVMAIVC